MTGTRWDTTRVAFDPPLDWEILLRYFAARAIAGVEHIDGGAYRRTIVVDGQAAVLEIALDGDDHLAVRSRGAPPSLRWEVSARAGRIFGLDVDVAGAHAHLARDPTIGPLVARRPGIRPAGTWDPFETGVRAIVGQQITVTGASTIIARLVARHGRPADAQDNGLTHTFPPAETLAAADLDGLGLTQSRVAAIRAFAAAVAAGSIRLDRSVDLDELVASITAVRGLGPWTAHYLALRVGEPDAFPDSDLGLRRAASNGALLSARELAVMAESWRPWRAFAAAWLWMS